MCYQCLLIIYGWNCSWKCGYWYQAGLNVDLADLLVALWFPQLDFSVGVSMLAPQERLQGLEEAQGLEHSSHPKSLWVWSPEGGSDFIRKKQCFWVRHRHKGRPLRMGCVWVSLRDSWSSHIWRVSTNMESFLGGQIVCYMNFVNED